MWCWETCFQIIKDVTLLYMVMLESTMHNIRSRHQCQNISYAADDILRLTNNFSDFVLASSLAEEVTVVDTVSGPMVWCTFKNFLSVTFMFSVLGSCTSDAANWHDHRRRSTVWVEISYLQFNIVTSSFLRVGKGRVVLRITKNHEVYRW